MSIKKSDAPEPKMVAYSLAYAAKGVPVFPLIPGNKEPLIGGGRAYYDATTDAQVIRAWWSKEPQANIGIPMITAGLCAIDPDPRNGGTLDGLIAALGPLPPTLTSRTGGGGWHLVFKHPGCQLEAHVPGIPGIDVKVNGYIVAPPSLHPSGNRYEWIGDIRVPVELPEHYVEALRKRKPERPQGRPLTKQRIGANDAGDFWLRRALARSQESSRNDTGFWLACQLRDAGVSEAEAHVLMCAYARFAPEGKHAYEEREALASMAQAYQTPAREPARSLTAPSPVHHPRIYVVPDHISDATGTEDEASEGGGEEQEPPARFGRHDAGNAERLISRYGSRLLYCAPWKRWLVWDGARWTDDDSGQVMRWAKATARSIYGEAEACEDPQEAKDVARHAIQSHSARAIQAMVTLAQSERPVVPAELDGEATTWLLNFRNGTLDLHTGELRPPAQAHRITKLAPEDYDPNAKCPTFLAFLDRIMGGDADLIAFLQRAIGYSMTGDTSEQIMFIPWGPGANGKSTLLDVIGEALGNYAMHTSPETFMVRKNEGPRQDIARLKGARFVSAVESEDGQRLAESLVKQITGGDLVTARHLYSGDFEFKPSLKLWFATNHKPNIRGTDDAIWRRIRLIPFTVTIPEGERDKRLPKKLRAELPGILAWAVQGCLAWQREGIGKPERVARATEEYRSEMDTLGGFITDCCVSEPRAWVPAGQLYARYEAWCSEMGERNPLTQRSFGMRLTERGYTRDKGTGGQRIWRGLGTATSGGSGPSGPDSGKVPHEKIRLESLPEQQPLGPLPPLSEGAEEPTVSGENRSAAPSGALSLRERLAGCKHPMSYESGNEIRCSDCDEVLDTLIADGEVDL